MADYDLLLNVTYRQASTSSGRRYLLKREQAVIGKIRQACPDATIKHGWIIGQLHVSTAYTLPKLRSVKLVGQF